MKFTSINAFAATATLAVALSGCVLETVNETVDKQSVQDAHGFTSLTVTDQGSNDIDVTGTSSDSVTAMAKLDVWASTSDRAQQIAGRVEFGWQGATDAQLKLKYGSSDQELAKLTHLSLVAPARLALNLETSSGDVAVSGMKNDVHIETSSGEIHAVTAGHVTLKTSSGDITASTGLGGTLDLSSGDATVNITSKDFDGLVATTSSGNVKVNIADSARVTLDLSTSSGSINVDYSGTRTSSANGDLQLQINGGGKVVRLETSSGDITVSTLR